MKAAPKAPHTLAIDIGGTHVKASVLDPKGRMIAPELRHPTPRRAIPPRILEVIIALAEQLPPFDRISVGFPGYVEGGRIRTAPNLGTRHWRGFALADALANHLRKPARVLNDADVQGLGVIDGRGLECVLTLGTGVGSALFDDGRLLPHLELGQHPIGNHKTYDQYLGDATLKAIGRQLWNRRLRRAIDIVATLTNYDRLHLGGGNAAAIRFALPENVKIAANAGGITGGIKLWDEAFDDLFRRAKSRRQ